MVKAWNLWSLSKEVLHGDWKHKAMKKNPPKLSSESNFSIEYLLLRTIAVFLI